MRRRRTNNGTWLPVSTSDVAEGFNTLQLETQGLHVALPVDGNGAIFTYVLPLTQDAPIEGDAYGATESLADVIGSEYFLKRLVGKLYAAYTEAAEGGFDFCKIAAGFFVARVDSRYVETPIGANISNSWLSDASEEDYRATQSYSPLAVATVREPWIWRRSWVLASSLESLPRSTANYGSVLDGPHIDAKTKRRVVNDERLFFAISTSRWPYLDTGSGAADGQLDVDIDLRIFGALRKATQRGVF